MATYFWLRLHRDFFKRHDTRIIENMENGKDYLLFYLKLLCESVDHEGRLRFSDTIPYDASMLSTITNTNIDIVRAAVNVFSDLKLMDVLDDGTFYFTQVESMTGSVTSWAAKKREWRAKQKALAVDEDTQEDNLGHVRQEIEQEQEIEIKKEEEGRDEVFDTYRRCIDSNLPATAWHDTHKQRAALKQLSEMTRDTAPKSAIPDPVDFALAIVGVYTKMKAGAKSDYWRSASWEPTTVLRRFGELVEGLKAEYAQASRWEEA